ncbi:hypothetical protein APY03_3209 [Variovorax sp. WDL1]|nr:hypothetical protein APY03_3209 [Variovorax sp. WDL1]
MVWSLGWYLPRLTLSTGVVDKQGRLTPFRYMDTGDFQDNTAIPVNAMIGRASGSSCRRCRGDDCAR